jgi:hypothetical protein
MISHNELGKFKANYLLILLGFGTFLNAEVNISQGAVLFLQSEYTKENIKNMLPADKEKLLEQYANFESYRPDSFSDASRNPFGPKRYKIEDLKN